jgi:hypothetical protein
MMILILARMTSIKALPLRAAFLCGLFSAKVFHMVETRAAPRFRLMKAAKIEYGGVKTPCMIRDLSVTGAALEISELCEVQPDYAGRRIEAAVPCRLAQ